MIFKAPRLNGWRRAWVLLSAIWLLLLGYHGFDTFPGRGDAFIQVGGFSCLMHKTYGPDAKRAILAVMPEMDSVFDPVNHKCRDMLDRIEQTGHQPDFTRLYDQYLNESRISLIVRLFGYWIAPVLAAYLLGLAIAWVVRGFRGNPS